MYVVQSCVERTSLAENVTPRSIAFVPQMLLWGRNKWSETRDAGMLSYKGHLVSRKKKTVQIISNENRAIGKMPWNLVESRCRKYSGSC